MTGLGQYSYDVLAVGISLVLFAAYYAFLLTKLRANATYTIQGVNELARALWVIHVMTNPNKDIMAVQTLRNFIMGSSLMASTAALLIIGTLTLSGQAENIAHNWHIFNQMGTHTPELWIIKVICLLAVFIAAFFAFVMSVRLANQVLFMLNVPDTEAHPSLSPNEVAKRMNRSGGMFAIGLRLFFFSVPLVFWLFGPFFLVLSSLGLVFALYRLDKA